MFGNQRAISSSRQLTTIGIAGMLLAAILFIAPIQPGMQNAFAVNGDLDADVCESDLDGVWLIDTL